MRQSDLSPPGISCIILAFDEEVQGGRKVLDIRMFDIVTAPHLLPVRSMKVV